MGPKRKGKIRGVMSIRWGFFFQAEDGIRDLVRSRGLGDVYKRQAEESEGKSPESSETKMAGCVASLEKMKSDEPERYECTTKCVGDAKDSASFVTCASDCKGASASASKSDDDDATKTYPVDSLSSSEVRSKISIAYSSYGYDISGEKSNLSLIHISEPTRPY